MRYVDNRLSLSLDRGGVLDIPDHFLRSDFYGNPVLLEPEPDLCFLGAEIHIVGCTVQLSYKVQGFDELAADPGVGDADVLIGAGAGRVAAATGRERDEGGEDGDDLDTLHGGLH